MGRAYGAKLVVWGSETDDGWQIHCLNLAPRRIDPAIASFRGPEPSDATAKAKTFATVTLPRQFIFYALYALAGSFMDTGEYLRSLAAVGRAIESVPDDEGAEGLERAYVLMGWLYQMSAYNDPETAVAAYSEAIRLKPDLAEAHHNRGTAYAALGDAQQAIADYSEAIRLKPDYAESYLNRGLAYAGRGQYDQAVVDYNEAIRLKPDEGSFYCNRGFTYAEQGDREGAIADLQRALDLGLPPQQALLAERTLQRLQRDTSSL